MFSKVARARMLERGWSLSSLLMFFKDSAAESRGDMSRHRSQTTSIVVGAGVCYTAAVASAVLVYGDAAVVSFSAYTALGVVAFGAWACASVALLRTHEGAPVTGVGLANHLTLARFYLIIPTLVYFHDGHYAAALTTYVVLGATDIADGVVARVCNQRSEFGVVFDPLADVFATAALFAVFLAHGLVPLWLFLILMARYLMLFVGSFALFLVTGPVRFKATIPGKVVGLVQGAGISAVIVCALSGRDWLERIAPVMFPVLGVCFASIIVSQFVIGARHVRASAGSQESGVRVES